MAKPIEQASENAQIAADDETGTAFTNRDSGDATPPAANTGESKGEKAARDAELARQREIQEAVAKAHDDELPKLGGPSLNPGAPDA